MTGFERLAATAVAFLAFGPSLLVSTAAAADLQITGPEGRARTVTEAELKAMPHETAVLDDHGERRAYQGVSLSALTALIGTPRGEAVSGRAMNLLAVVTASDGYRVTFALPEIDPSFTDRKVILADAKAGQPLDAREGPFRLVVEGDRRPARAARNVVGIEVRRVE